MKHYNQPQTNVLQVLNNSILCVSEGPGPAPAVIRGQLGVMISSEEEW